MVDEIKQRYEVEADEALRAHDQVADATKRVGDETKETGEKADDASNKVGILQRGYTALLSSVGGLLAAYGGAAGFNYLLRLNTEELERNAAAANELKKAQVDLQFLSQGYRYDELAAVEAASNLGTGTQAELAGVFANLKSKTAALDDQSRIALFEQLVETSLSTSASPSDLVGLFARGSQFVNDPERLQNMIREAQRLSPAASPTALEATLPSSLAVGNTVGLTAEQTTGLLVAAITANEESGANSLRNIMTILAGGTTPDGLDILKNAGASPGSGIVNQLDALRNANLGVEQITTLFGRENYSTISAILQLNQYGSNIESLYQATQGGRDLSQEAIQNIYSSDRQQALRLQNEQIKNQIQNLQARDVGAQEYELIGNLLELQRLEEGGSSLRGAIDQGLYRALAGTEFLDPESAAALIRQSSIGPNRASGFIDQAIQAGPQTSVTIIGQQFNNAEDPGLVDSGRTDLP